MSKYDFGYNIDDNDTNLWAFKKILEGTRVLELGSAGGTLTKSLYEEKKCAVDIVELDEADGKKAAQYAVNSIIGSRGNLNDDVWYTLLEKEKYDYIVALDVLEHLMNPEHTLRCAAKLLKPDGIILLSIPNLAHNAVIIELLKNNFPYTKLGLLDNTHIHFFAYETICEMIQNIGLHIDKKEGVIKCVSDTEITADYSDVCAEQAHLLKQRKYGEVYQYLLEISLHGERETIDLLNNGQTEKIMFARLLINGSSENMLSEKINYGENILTIVLPDDLLINSIRFVPYEGDGLVTDLQAYGIETEGIELKYNWTSAHEISSGAMIVEEKGSLNEVNYLLDQKYKIIRIKYNLVPLFEREIEAVRCVLENLGKKAIKENKQLIEQKKELETELQKVCTQKIDLEEQLKKTCAQKMNLEENFQKTYMQKEILEKKISKIYALLDEIHYGKIWKIFALFKEKN